MPAKPKPVYVKVTFSNPERGEEDISNALDMADFPAEVEAVDVPALVEALEEMLSQFGHYCEHTEDPDEIAAQEKARAALGLNPLQEPQA